MALSKPPLKYPAEIKEVGGNLKPIPINKQLQEDLNNNYKVDDKVWISIKKRQRQRSQGRQWEESNQNGYLWAVVLPILAQYFGYTNYEMLDALRPLFFSEVHDKDPHVRKLLSTTEYTAQEWEQKMEEIRIWALQEHDIKIPEPNEVDLDGDN